jgi:GNAT superfamily N-acetyltransferase
MVVLPEAQGRGIGKKLVMVVTDKADAENMPCYLESSRDKPNMAIYERMGFRFAKQMDCDDDGTVCKLYCMIREPRQGPPEGAVGTPAAETHAPLL